ncbi:MULTISPECIES: LAETG motif-containing sortase-dependent surface protein [unclassified Streptomyces]|uniref:LAETG motif-containing sortase-dependent surface protein n=1 Tax=unclassified Streptomyces TaxID=2593676 RepID=UPI00039C2456|nr:MULTISPECIES: LAETG motif-containing sortase-dependent surface protein [unclassified Streptomyces]MYX31948.1 Cys-Gln thioester bond-forming surface protein [Streptomyces sp. SID8377]
MFTVRRRGAARLSVAMVASGLLAAGSIAVAGSAIADDATPTAPGATATLGGLKTADKAVIKEKGKAEEHVSAGLFEMSVDGGGTIQTYCIDIKNPTQTEAKYKEVSWDQSSLHDNDDAGKINWILQNSYPQVDDLSALQKTAEIKDGALTPELAAAGTQVAIWRFSDKADVTAVDPVAEQLADWLEGNAKDLKEPAASLTLDPPAVSGKAGDLLGPIKVSTNASTVQVSPAPSNPSGVKVTDKNGTAVTSAKNGDELYFDVEAGTPDGTTSLTATANTKLPVGRAFTGVDSTTQVQILAGSSDSSVSATATGTWAAKGPIPAVSAEVNCAKNGLDVTAANEGDQPFTFKLADKDYTVEAGKSETITVPVAEDQHYKVTISGPEGFEKTFEGVLDCETAGNGGDTPSSSPSPATAGGSSEGTGDTGSTTGGDLAETGSSSATPVIAGIAIALVVVGGGAVFFLRKKKAAPSAE